MSAADAIDLHAIAVTLLTDMGGSYNADGEWIENNPASSIIDAVIQPSKGVQLMDLPEGLREQAQYFLWSRAPVEVDDRILTNGKTYRVLFAWPRPEGGFTRAALGLLK